MAYYYLMIALLLLLWGGSIYLILRPGGVVENVLQNRDRRLVVLESQTADILGRLAKIGAEVVENAAYAQNHVQQVKNRLTSIETRAGKQTAAESKEELRENFMQYLQQQNKQLNTGG